MEETAETLYPSVTQREARPEVGDRNLRACANSLFILQAAVGQDARSWPGSQYLTFPEQSMHHHEVRVPWEPGEAAMNVTPGNVTELATLNQG